MLFETERLYVRKWKSEELEALYHLFNDEAIKETIAPLLTIEECEFIFNEQLKNYEAYYPFGRFFIIEKESNDIIGLLLIKEIDLLSNVEIGYSLMKDQWNKGFATEIVQGGINWLFSLNKFSTICATTDTGNINSQRVLDKCGFSEDILMEKNHDELYFSLTKNNS